MISIVILCIVALIALAGAVFSGVQLRKPEGPAYFIILLACAAAFFICIAQAVERADKYEKEQQGIRIEIKR